MIVYKVEFSNKLPMTYKMYEVLRKHFKLWLTSQPNFKS